MNWIIEYIENRHYIKITYDGLFSVSEQLTAIEDLLGSKFWRPGIPILIDHRKLDFGKTDISTMQQTSMFHQKNDARIGKSRIAVIMKSLSDFGRGRQFELLSKGKVSAELEIFLDKEEEAINWLLK